MDVSAVAAAVMADYSFEPSRVTVQVDTFFVVGALSVAIAAGGAGTFTAASAASMLRSSLQVALPGVSAVNVTAIAAGSQRRRLLQAGGVAAWDFSVSLSTGADPQQAISAVAQLAAAPTLAALTASLVAAGLGVTGCSLAAAPTFSVQISVQVAGVTAVQLQLMRDQLPQPITTLIHSMYPVLPPPPPFVSPTAPPAAAPEQVAAGNVASIAAPVAVIGGIALAGIAGWLVIRRRRAETSVVGKDAPLRATCARISMCIGEDDAGKGDTFHAFEDEEEESHYAGNEHGRKLLVEAAEPDESIPDEK